MLRAGPLTVIRRRRDASVHPAFHFCRCELDRVISVSACRSGVSEGALSGMPSSVTAAPRPNGTATVNPAEIATIRRINWRREEPSWVGSSPADGSILQSDFRCIRLETFKVQRSAFNVPRRVVIALWRTLDASRLEFSLRFFICHAP
jgi:hypothetical protein